MESPVSVALIFGGQSSEHGVSCLTAANVLKAIDREKYDVIPIGITRDGRWARVPLDVVESYQIIDSQVPSVAEPDHDLVWMSGPSGCEVATRAGDRLVDTKRVDVAFALLHGPFGEDGTVQGMFEMLKVRYVGSGVCASAVGMDKRVMRVVFEAAGLPVGPYVGFDAISWRDDRQLLLDRIGDLRYPLYVKPARGGSSLGISRVENPSELDQAISFAQQFDPNVVVEQGFVGAREVECAVLGDPDGSGGCRTSAIGEIRVSAADGFYDFETKYLAESKAELDIPATLDEETSARLRDMAARAYRAVGAEGLSRVDMLIDAEGGIWLNEINTMPGFTRISMYPALWQTSGLSYSGLVDHLIQLALDRPLGLR